MFILIKEELGEYTPQHPEIIVCSRFGNDLKDYVDDLTFKHSETSVFRHADEWEDKEIWMGNDVKKKQIQERRFYFLIAVQNSRDNKNWHEHTVVYKIEEVEEI